MVDDPASKHIGCLLRKYWTKKIFLNFFLGGGQIMGEYLMVAREISQNIKTNNSNRQNPPVNCVETRIFPKHFFNC